MPKPKSKATKDDSDHSKKTKTTKKGNANIIEESKEQSDLKNEQSTVTVPVSSSQEIVVSSSTNILKPETLGQSEEAIVEIKYDEPVLTSIVVEKYEGEKEKGLFEGLGKITYKGGNVYEGEFRLGMMTGKGKYTWKEENITYEGDFLENEITGVGMYTWFDLEYPGRPATYQGDVFKGKRHGRGVFKSGRTQMIYSGEWNCGKLYGKGKMIFDSEGKSFYEGDWINNKKFGWGIFHYASGNIYEGMWVNDVRHGEGTMRWFNKNQIYTGQWENGVQNGLGEHSWYLARIDMTQYCLRNTYYGSFKNGKRDGHGTFLYADGSKYEGMWKNNLKDGMGKFTSKDGTIYEGYFEDDKMTDSISNKRNSVFAQELNQIKARIPSAGTTLNLNAIKTIKDINKVDLQVKLDLSSILEDFQNEEKRNLEIIQAHKTVIRYLELFKHIYRFYSQLGFDTSPDNTYVLNRMQFWRLLLDCKVNLNEDYLTLMDFDRLLNPAMNPNDLHCPYDKIILREFFNYIVLTSYYLYKDQYEGSGSILSWCIEKLIEDNLLPHACNVQGEFYSDPRRTLSILSHMVKSFEIYRMMCFKRKSHPGDFSMTVRHFLSSLNEFSLINPKILTVKEVIEIISKENPIIYDSENSYNVGLEITFLEFFEALIGCASKIYAKQNQKDSKILTIDSSQLDVSHDSKAVYQLENLNLSEIQISEKKKSDQDETRLSKQFDEKPNHETMSINFEKTIINDIEESKNDKKELDSWTEQNSYFFMSIFFPAADLFFDLNKLLNVLL